MSEKSGEHRRLVHGRRKGHRLRARQAGLVESLLPQVRAAFAPGETLNPASLFDPKRDEIWLEIGFGAGEHLAARALERPNAGIIGCEPFINGVAKLLTRIDEDGLSNVRIHDGDARDLLDALADNCIDRVFILYPDPWPKTRHHKRRFISRDNLNQLARIMRPGAELRFASDIADYVRWTLDHLRRDRRFEWTAETAVDWRNPPNGWPGTRYEAKALAAGRVPTYLSFRRLP